MEDFYEKFEELSLSLDQEKEKERNLSMQLLFAETAGEADDIITEIAELAESSENGRTFLKIEDCINTLKLNCSGAHISDVILNGVSNKLFPIFFKNLLDDKEHISLENIENLTKSLDPIMANKNIHNIAKVQIAKNVFNLFRVLNGEPRREK